MVGDDYVVWERQHTNIALFTIIDSNCQFPQQLTRSANESLIIIIIIIMINKMLQLLDVKGDVCDCGVDNAELKTVLREFKQHCNR